LAVVSGDGGGVYSLGGTVTLTNTTVSGNTASGSGGGMSSLAGTVTLTNTTVSGNTVRGSGGGVNASGSRLTLTNTTISGNTTGSGGGVATASGGRLTLTNTIVSGNTASSGGGNCAAVITSGGNNLESPTSGAGTCSLDAVLGDKIGADPLLGTLTLNPPGTTATHALLPGSAAIDGVTFQTAIHCTGPVGAGTPTPVTIDQRGVQRPQGPGCDIGAYEFRSPPACILADINCDGIVDIRDYGVWRLNFGQSNCGNPADLNSDCIVDIQDYGIWRQNFGHTAGGAAPGTAPHGALPLGTATPTRTPSRRPTSR
jgi:hypothetical protein